MKMNDFFTMLMIILLASSSVSSFFTNTNSTGGRNETTIHEEGGNETTIYEEGGNETTTHKGGTLDITNMPIKDICQIFGIPEIQCTCDNFPDFCPTKEDKYEFKCDRYYDTVEGVVKITASAFGIIGNAIVLFITYKTWKGMHRFRKLIALLALADFVFAALEVVDTIPLFWTCQWIYSLFWCKFLSGASNIGGVFSQFLITVIALERYIAVVKPFSPFKSENYFWLWPIIAALLSVASTIPLIIVTNIDSDKLCIEQWPIDPNSSLIYSWCLLVVTFVLPMLIIVYFYFRVVREISWSTKKVSGMQSNENMLDERNKCNRKTMIILFAISFAFFLLVLPNRVAWIVFDTVGVNNLSLKWFRILKYICVFPFMFHVAINPIIYSFIDKKFRKDFLNIIKCKGNKPRTPSVTSTRTKKFSIDSIADVWRKMSRTEVYEVKQEK